MRRVTMTQKTMKYIIVLMVILFFCQITANKCPKRWKTCGESFCCCNSGNAECINQNLTYIPKLPEKIKYLKFKGNNIKTLSAELFLNISSSSIKHLKLTSNGIENVHNDTFAGFSKLRKLSLQANRNLNWSQFKKAMYSIQRNIHSLLLDDTGLSSLPDDLFDGLRNTNITLLTLSNNKIKRFNEQPFYHLQNLQTLELNHNWIEEIQVKFNRSRPGHMALQSLQLAYNGFVKWPPWFCDTESTNASLYPKLTHLDLTGNAIIVLVRKAWSCLKNLRRLNLAKNVIQILRDDTFLDLESLQVLDVSHMANPIHTIKARAFHTKNLKELHFDYNHIDFEPDSLVPYAQLFTFCPNLTKLFLGYNKLRSICDSELVTLLSPLTRLIVLHLDGANLYKIPENILHRFINLKELYLGMNKIESINTKAFINVTKLEVLHLEDNKIKVVNDTFPMTLQRSLKRVDLAGNPFSCLFCAPNNNTWLRYWIDSSRSKIKFIYWPAHYKCASPSADHGKLLAEFKPKKKDCEIKDPMIVAYVTIGVFLVLFTVFGAAGYKARWYVRYWTIKIQRKLTGTAKADPERQRLLGDNLVYDVFVIYHDDDRGFVRHEILKFMENENHYKLFIWDRDFSAGDQTVGIVVDNIYKSNHVVAVISKSFLKDQWCEFQLAVSLDRQIELKKNFLTLITLENVDKKLLSKSWCVLLTKTTTAEWCESKNDIRRKLFEQKILTSVPSKNAGRTARSHANSVNFDSDD